MSANELLFRLPGKPAVALKNWGNLPIELLCSAAGVKPVTHCWVQEADLPYVESLRASLGLSHLVYTRQSDPGGATRLGVMMGQKPADLERCAAVWDAPRSNPGPLLGYPECCSDLYCRRIEESQRDGGATADVVRRARARTKSAKPWPFLLNDAFYLYSRPWVQGQEQRRESVYALNRALPMNLLNVIPWHPCSYECKASLDKAKKAWKLLEAGLPDLAVVLRACLARPVVFWDWDRFAVLRGKALSDGASYEAVQPPYSSVEPASLELLGRGDRLRERGGALEVLKGGKTQGRLEGEPVLLRFG